MLDSAIINYPGSKKKLLEYIYTNTYRYINKNKYILDVFSGTGCVSEMYSNNGYKVISNDVEKYAYNISKATICENNKNINLEEFENHFLENKEKLKELFNEELKEEQNYLKSDSKDIINFYEKLLKIWDISSEKPLKINGLTITSIDDLNINIDNIPFLLFTLYYSSSYFGLEQAIDIDSLRYAIKKTDSENSLLYASLYYAMKECVFSKDGHMAQPLNLTKNINKLFKVRKNNIFSIFKEKLLEFISVNYTINDSNNNLSYNMELNNVLQDDFIKENVGFIYADPPYTDMQYSRYFHLLNTITEYRYPHLTSKNGKLTTGLYADNRFQSNLSNKSSALNNLKNLIKFAAENNMNIAFSYAFPVDVSTQKSDRYTMHIDDLIECVKTYFPKSKIVTEDYLHSNNRNKDKKRVLEYLVIGYTQKKEELDYSEINKIEELKKSIDSTIATNKNSLYDSMLYWSQKPYNICDLILEKFSKENDIILDPFMGSGVTIIESLNKKFSRNAIGIDINETPIFLCDTVLKKYDLKSFNNIIANVKEKISKIEEVYYTKCTCGNKNAIIKKILYDREPNLILKELTYSCSCSKKDLTKLADEEDFLKFKKDREINNLVNLKLLENSKIAVKENEHIKDKFSNRSFYVLDYIYKVINEEQDFDTKIILNYAYSAIIHKSKIVDKKMSSQWPLWIPKTDCLERNIIELFFKSIDKTILALKYAEENYYVGNKVDTYNKLSSNNYLLLKNGIQNIDDSVIPDNSVDLVITDPPYLGQVAYSEYMQLYETFLNTKIDFKNEIVISTAKDRKKDLKDYLDLLEKGFKNVNRMMKNKSYMFMYFHDSNLSIWSDLINILKKSNFVFVTAVHIKKNKLTLKKILDPKKTMNGESLLLFKKDDNNSWTINTKDIDTIIKELEEKSEELINNSKSKSLSTTELYDNGILEFIIKNDYLSILSRNYKDLIDIFEQFLIWDEENICWKIKK